ncbi:MAG: hypothetical protein ISN29_10650 [Gammaproteobacteria bacterium AqS3]|nr:hypothetical protein [Gammaproteobacteria bacterium AqS3]
MLIWMAAGGALASAQQNNSNAGWFSEDESDESLALIYGNLLVDLNGEEICSAADKRSFSEFLLSGGEAIDQVSSPCVAQIYFALAVNQELSDRGKPPAPPGWISQDFWSGLSQVLYGSSGNQLPP